MCGFGCGCFEPLEPLVLWLIIIIRVGEGLMWWGWMGWWGGGEAV